MTESDAPYQLADFHVYVESTKLRIRLRQLDVGSYEVSGTPDRKDEGPQDGDRIVPDMTGYEEVKGELGLMSLNPAQAAGWYHPLVSWIWKPLEQVSASQGLNKPFREILYVQGWKGKNH